MKSSIVLAAIAMLLSINATAQHIHKTKARQHGQVYHGVRCANNITPQERVAIANQKQDVRLAVRVAKSDGVITPAERRIIRQERGQANRTVYRASTNNRMR